MIVELGHFALVLALALSLVQSVLPVVGAYRGDERLMNTAVGSSVAIFLAILLSFVSLTYAYVVSDFSVANVWANSHTLQPLIYKYTGVWGNHEGSMLLWVLILAVFGGAVAVFGRNLPLDLKANVLGVQAWIMVAFLAFLVMTSNPFIRLEPAPFEGKDLNPILQDIGLAIHPPMLYLGYVGFSITFSFAMAAMLSGRIDAAWARWVRPWALAAWVFLTAGISMGSYWAYYELGWGGYWFWDPVENASFIPWLSGTALLHSAIVMEKREALKVWTILLSLITFSMALLGTFLVRSGVLTSVHAFATDPERGVFILAILVVFIGGSLFLFALRAPLLRNGGLFSPISREGALVFNNLFLTTAAATVLIGTLYPLLLEAVQGAKISVGAPFFNLTFGPLMIPLLMAVPIGPLLAWKRGDLFAALQRLYFAAGAALVTTALVFAYGGDTGALSALGFGLAVYVILGAFAEVIARSGFPRVSVSTGMARLSGLPRSVWGSALGHAGLGMTMLGIVSVGTFEKEVITQMTPGQTVSIAGYDLKYLGVNPSKGSNFVEDIVRVEISGNGTAPHVIEPSKRIYTTRKMPTTEAGIENYWFSQLYVSPGEINPDGSVAMRIWWKPLVTLIWLGTVSMVLGGLVSLSDRRLRVGAPRPSRAKNSEAPAHA